MVYRPMRLSLVCALGAFMIVFAGCSGDGTTLGPTGTPLDSANGDNGDNGGNGDNGDPQTVTLATLNAEIFMPKCATSGCHSGPQAAGGMSLDADAIADEIIGIVSQGYGISRVAPGDPDNSLIVKKVRADADAGGQMPRGAAPLADEEIAKIVEWIEAGANP